MAEFYQESHQADMDVQALQPRIAHIMLHVADMDKSLGFYCDILGMEVKVKRDNHATGHRNYFVGYPEARNCAEIELTSYADKQSYTHGDGYGHVGLSVSDCKEACRYFAENGVMVVRGPKIMPSGSVIAFIADPDDYQIEVLEYPRKST